MQYKLVNKSTQSDIMLQKFIEVLQDNTTLTSKQIELLAARYVFMLHEMELNGKPQIGT